jgi:tryptophanyl-tRNA synthetase
VDVSYHYLRFFLEDDARLDIIKQQYGSGKMYTGDVKKELIGILQKFVSEHQQRRATITDETVKKFLEIRKLKC